MSFSVKAQVTFDILLYTFIRLGGKMKKKALFVIALAAVLVFTLAACKSGSSSSGNKTVTLKCLADTTPHAEILEHAKGALAKEGIKVKIVSKTWDDSWNEQVENGDVDFNYDQYVPYMNEWNKAHKGHLVSMGAVHLEPLVMCSDKYKKLSDLPDNATIAIKSDVTNEYRCLELLKQAGFIELSKDITTSNADLDKITKYNKKIKIVPMDADVIMRDKQDFDAYITNTNRLLDAGLDPTDYLVREKAEDSKFANVIVTSKDNKNKEAIKKLVKVLQSDDMKAWINKHYKGAVVAA